MTDSSFPRVRLRAGGLLIELEFQGDFGTFVDHVRSLWRESLAAEDSGAADVSIAVVRRGETVPSAVASRTWITADPTDPEASYRLSGDITTAVLRHLVGSRLLLHAGAVRTQNAGIVVLTGASGAGKSTSVTTLARQGSYITDELTVLDPETFQIEPFTKPISVITTPGAGSKRVKQDVALADLGITHTPARLVTAPDHLVLVSRNADVAAAHVEHLGLIDCVAVLSSQSSSVWKLESPLGTLVRFVRSLRGAWVATYAESADLPRALEEAIAREPVGGLSREEAESVQLVNPSEVVCEAPGAGEYVLAPFTEALWCGTRLAVLTDSPHPTVVQLEGLGAVIWEIVSEMGSASEETLVREVVAAAGPHPESERLVADALGTLVRERALHRG